MSWVSLFLLVAFVVAGLLLAFGFFLGFDPCPADVCPVKSVPQVWA